MAITSAEAEAHLNRLITWFRQKNYTKVNSSLCARARKGSDIDTIFYWGKISSYKNGEYDKKISELKETDLIKDLGNQICILSEICERKMSYFKYGTVMLALAIITTGIQYFLIYTS